MQTSVEEANVWPFYGLNVPQMRHYILTCLFFYIAHNESIRSLGQHIFFLSFWILGLCYLSPTVHIIRFEFYPNFFSAIHFIIGCVDFIAAQKKNYNRMM